MSTANSLRDWMIARGGTHAMQEGKGIFWVVEYLDEDRNTSLYLKDIVEHDYGGIDTYWTYDIHKALRFDSEGQAQTEIDGSIDHAIRNRSRNCVARQHSWIS